MITPVPTMAGSTGVGPRSPALHLTNGDCTVSRLRGTGLAHVITPWRDVLHEGPVPDVPDVELRRIRAQFLTRSGADDIGTEEELAARDRLVEEHRHGYYVLWFEADLYDQLQIVQIVSQLRGLGVPPARVRLICVGEFVGVAHFAGLGQLSVDQLSRLPGIAAVDLTEASFELAANAWAALRARDPVGIRAIADAPSGELRFLAEAFDRLAREYPSTRDGLSLTERRILAAIEEGASTAGDVFSRVSGREPRPFLGDTWCFDRMTTLMRAPVPLLGTQDDGTVVRRDSRVHLTQDGRRVLAGRDDHVVLNGLDRWVGGVHLSGHDVPWRWDEGLEAITTVG